MWGKLPFKTAKIEVDDKSDELELLKQAYQALKSGQWLVLELKAAMPERLFAALRQLSLNNHLQIIHKDKMIEIRQTAKSRLIAIGSPEAIKENEAAFAGFKNLFGPAIIL